MKTCTHCGNTIERLNPEQHEYCTTCVQKHRLCDKCRQPIIPGSTSMNQHPLVSEPVHEKCLTNPCSSKYTCACCKQ